MTYELTHLRALEAESIHIIREVAAEFERPVLLFSGGKDSIVMLHLAEKAFWPAQDAVPGDARRHRAQLPRGPRVPRPPGRRARRPAGRGLACRTTIDAGRVVEETGPAPAATGCRPPRCSTRSRSTASTPCSAAPAATRRRPAPRSGCSASATSSASGTRRTSAPSCGASTTAGTARASTSACSRSSNWTELDIWQYIAEEDDRAAVDLLRAHAARCSGATACCWPSTPFITPADGEEVVRGAPSASARSATRRAPARSSRPPTTLEEVIAEVAATRITERGATRADDRFSEAAMEDRKKEGYF